LGDLLATGIKPHHVWMYEDRVKPLLAKGLENPELVHRLVDQAKTGATQLWCVFNGFEIQAAVLTELVTIGSRKVCNIISVGGRNMGEWFHHVETIEAWARENGCVDMRHANCRTGWARKLKDYKTTRITLEKAL
jgi:hypothetical protein